MSALRKIFSTIRITPERYSEAFRWTRCMCLQSSAGSSKNDSEKLQLDSESQHPNQTENPPQPKIEKTFPQLAEYRFIYPEFLPDPAHEFRNKIREKLERQDMLNRRSVIDIPEFYVGSILAVTTSDPYAPGKENKFVGICIARTYTGLRSTFTLRNIVDGQGVEILYDMYNPTILFMEVLKLEKRLDDHLYYLRDAPPEYSTVPFDMVPEFRVHDDPVPLNPIKVPLKPLPWHAKWEQRSIRGAIIEVPDLHYTRKRRVVLRKIEPLKELEARDIVKEYRRCIPEEDQEEIWKDVDDHLQLHPPRKQAWKRTLQKAAPKKRRSLERPTS